MSTLSRGRLRGHLRGHLAGAGGALAVLLTLPALSVAAGAAKQPAAASATADQPLIGGSRIAAVVNGDVISDADIANRARLFAISTGLPCRRTCSTGSKPQILRQLIDERLRMQEVQRRKIVIQDEQIAEAIKEIETRNGMQPGALRAKLAADGVSKRTLIDQIRSQLAWSQVLRQSCANRINISEADVAEQQKLMAQQIGQTEYRVGEIFIPVDDPANGADAQRFAETVISELQPARRSPSSPRSSARPSPRWRVASSAGCRPTSSIPPSPASSPKCRWARSAIRCGCLAACRSSRCRPSAKSATKWPPS